ncbi:MAG TPA: hypothetical protein DDW94_08485 [Deltaproteobacteria bacterium]|nr:MAG: hypothetical protein A2Z79_03010 [Deltaproteobacteria bacterium GWA2_55_82]OGQ62254.1 MAG: hypothetical protein A3I81_04915 [Deltaproteobacteria bacterium RIFCSPLOWO2_02_FULL_55_12]OIJ74366.1 MAG: hypothetical protein A2V21_308910 [Deltaproteobacteria bacterium GWC2_55_46]HBG47010.1 hypothetical protein [Deltaproteobacteria bacterium]HCY10930.1 hypothetical protein [Deltaproteobacteria bacterium]
MKRLYILAGVISALTFSASASFAGKSALQADYGNSLRTAKANQILDPQAGKELAPVYGLDGRSARGAVEKRMDSFEKKAEKPVYSLSIGKP